MWYFLAVFHLKRFSRAPRPALFFSATAFLNAPNHALAFLYKRPADFDRRACAMPFWLNTPIFLSQFSRNITYLHQRCTENCTHAKLDHEKCAFDMFFSPNRAENRHMCAVKLYFRVRETVAPKFPPNSASAQLADTAQN